MTQKEYIRKLRTRLAFVVSENERNDIIADIEEIFSDSMADGKSEEQICLSLGSPEETAKNILLEKGISSAGRIIITYLHKHMHTSFRQILLHTALKVLAVRQHACGFLPCLQQNYARKSAYILKSPISVQWTEALTAINTMNIL